MEAQWHPIKGYEDYEVSNEGEVYNKRTDMMVARSQGTGGSVKVNLWNGTMMKTRIVKNLVGQAFLEPLLYEAYDTVMIKDGDPWHLHVRNLCWRPRWYVIRHTAQWENREFDVERHIYNGTRGIMYPNVRSAAVSDGMLPEDIVNAVTQGEPSVVMHYIYEWVG